MFSDVNYCCFYLFSDIIFGILLQNLVIIKTASLESVLKTWYWSLKLRLQLVSLIFILHINVNAKF